MLCFTLYLTAIFQVQAPGELIFGGAIERRTFCVTSLGGLYLEGLIHVGAYFRNFTVFHRIKKKPETSSTTRCQNHHQTIIIIIIIIVIIPVIIALLHIVCPRHCASMTAKILWKCARANMKRNRFIIIRKCDISKCGPAKITKSKKNPNMKSKS